MKFAEGMRVGRVAGMEEGDVGCADFFFWRGTLLEESSSSSLQITVPVSSDVFSSGVLCDIGDVEIRSSDSLLFLVIRSPENREMTETLNKPR